MRNWRSAKPEDAPASVAAGLKAVDEALSAQRRGVARRQNAKSWELRGAMSLARLHRQQSRHEEAVALLAPVYGWLTEGFDAADLQAARTLLNDLEIERDALPSAERNKSAG